MITSSLLFGATLLDAGSAQAGVADTGFNFENIQIENGLPPDAPTLVTPSDGATGVSRSPYLSVQVSDPEADVLTVTFVGKRKGVSGPDFTIVALPDTQFYTVDTGGDLIFKAQTQWVVDNRASRNIVFVNHLGDATDHGQDSEWQIVDSAMSILESPSPSIPYGMVIGNRDKATGSTPYLYEQYFGVTRFTGRAYYGGHYGSNNLNYYELFSAGGMDFIVINLDSAVGTVPLSVLDWADGLLQTYSSRRAIVIGHYMILTGNPGTWLSQGQAIYEALKDRSNLFLMMGGHISGEGQRQDTYLGNTVYTLLSDYQSRNNGGDGWLRILEFSPNNNEIRVKTYSPTRDQWETDADSQFILPYDMAGTYATIGTVTGVTSGSTVGLYWPGLASLSAYEWYVTVSDGVNTTTSPVWSFTTEMGNQSPVANNNTYNTNEDTALNMPSPGVLANDSDPDGDNLTAIKLTNPKHGTLNLNNNGSFVYTPTPNFAGSDSFTYKAYDGDLDSNTASVSITVNPVNDPPQAVADSYGVDEDTVLNIVAPGILGNDSDPEGNPLTAIKLTNPQHGTLNLNSNGSFDYTPAPNFNGSDSFSYKANDGALDSNVVNITITVNPINDPPQTVADSYSTPEDTPLNVPAPGILTNDSDLDGDQLTAIKLTNPQHGTLTLDSDGSFVYTPAPDYAGSDVFTYKANDGYQDSYIANVSITVTPVNDPPNAVADSYGSAKDTALNVPAPGVLGNDSDPDGDQLTVIRVNNPQHGTLNLNSNGSFVYTPTPGFTGSDSFTYKATDGALNSNEVNVSITVSQGNAPPQAVADSYSMAEDTTLNMPAPGVLANDSDLDGDQLTAIKITNPQHGTLILNSNGSFVYTPTLGYIGSDGFTYKVNDGALDSNVVGVSITVEDNSLSSKIYISIVIR